MGEVAVIGDKEGAEGVFVESSGREEVFRAKFGGDEGEDIGAVGVGSRADEAGGFVEKDVAESVLGDRLTVDGDGIFFGVDLGVRFFNSDPVHRDLTGSGEGLYLGTGELCAFGDEFIETDKRHSFLLLGIY